MLIHPLCTYFLVTWQTYILLDAHISCVDTIFTKNRYVFSHRIHTNTQIKMSHWMYLIHILDWKPSLVFSLDPSIVASQRHAHTCIIRTRICSSIFNDNIFCSIYWMYACIVNCVCIKVTTSEKYRENIKWINGDTRQVNICVCRSHTNTHTHMIFNLLIE